MFFRLDGFAGSSRGAIDRPIRLKKSPIEFASAAVGAPTNETQTASATADVTMRLMNGTLCTCRRWSSNLGAKSRRRDEASRTSAASRKQLRRPASGNHTGSAGNLPSNSDRAGAKTLESARPLRRSRSHAGQDRHRSRHRGYDCRQTPAHISDSASERCCRTHAAGCSRVRAKRNTIKTPARDLLRRSRTSLPPILHRQQRPL